MSRQSEVRRVLVKADTKGAPGLKQMAKEFGKMNKSVKSSANSLGFFRRAFIGAFAGIGIREIARVSDRMELLNNRIAVLTTDGQDSVETLNKLTAAASRAKAPVDDLGEIYARLAAATKDTGLSSDTLVDITETLQQTFRISGSTITEATSAAIQLSQGLASGELRGQELRSVLEANVEIGDILSTSLGKTRGELYKFAEAGGITSKVVLEALINNMGRIDEKAAGLGQTMEQTVTVAMNDFKKQIFSINEQLDVSGKFAEGIAFLIRNLDNLGIIVGVLAASRIPLLIDGIKALRVAMIAFATTNPLLLAFVAITTGALLLINNFTQVKIGLLSLNIGMERFAKGTRILLADLARGAGLESLAQSYEKAALKIERSIFKMQERQKELRLELTGGKDAAAEEVKRLAEREARLKRELALLDKMGGKSKDLKGIIGDLNKQYRLGTIDVETYFKRLRGFNIKELNQRFDKGKIQVDKYNKAMSEIGVAALNVELNAGRISLADFNKGIESLKLDLLSDQLQSGAIDIFEYNKQLNALNTVFDKTSVLQQGYKGYLDSIGTLAENITTGITSAFKGLEDAFVDFIQGGKLSFEKFADAVIADLTRIIVRAAIIKPIVQGLLGDSVNPQASATGAPITAGNYNSVSAKGSSFENGVKRFAQGGIVSNPTMFGYGNGKRGLMGEAGSEAILPLSRGKGGDLGVQASVTPVSINIVNNSGGEVESRESTGANGQRKIDILISGKVKEGFANGSFDRVLKASYGLNRKGS